MTRKKTIIISSLILLAAILFTFLKGMMVTYTVLEKASPEFCPPPPMPMQPVLENRKLIKNGRLSFECSNMEETRELICRTIEELDGFISEERLSSHEDYASQWLKIRVPAKNFDTLMDSLSSGAVQIDERSTEIEDVTDQYYDAEARLAVKRDVENRYRELLKKADNIKDILAIEEQVAKLREEIESVEIQLKHYDDRVALSTLTVTYSETKEKPRPPTFLTHFGNGVVNGWNNLAWCFVGLVNIWPFLLMIAGVVLFYKLRKRTSDSTPPTDEPA